MARDRRDDRRTGGNGSRKTGGYGYQGKDKVGHGEVYDGRSTKPERGGSFYSKSKDRAEGGAPYGRSSDGGKPRYGNNPQGDRPYGNKPQGDRPYGSKPQGDRPYGNKTQGDRPYGNRPQGDRPYGNKPQGDRPYGNKPQGDRPYGNRPQGDRPYGNKPQGDRPYGNRPQGDRPYGNKPQSDRPYGNKPQGGYAYGDKPSQGDKPYGNKDMRYGKGALRPSAPTERPVPPSMQDDGGFHDSQARSDSFEPRYNDTMPENLLVGRNPIREAIRSGRSIEKLLVANGELSGSAREIVAKAREAGIIVQMVERTRLDAIYEKHQGMLAYVSAAEYSTVEAILAEAAERGEEPFVVVLDGVTDPHNLGAIIRTAECAGAHGVIIPERRSAGLNPAAVKAAAGALEYIKVARVVNITRTLDELKKAGLWIIGGTMDGQDIDSTDMSGPLALVVGAEGDGISQLVQKQLDMKVTLPLRGKIESLNASVAAGILMYSVLRNRSN